MDLKILENTPPWEWPEDAGPHFLKILGDDQILEALNHTFRTARYVFIEFNGESSRTFLTLRN